MELNFSRNAKVLPDLVVFQKWQFARTDNILRGIEQFQHHRPFNPCLTKGVVATPLRFFPGRSKTLKKVTKGMGNLFYILCCHFDKKKKIGGTTLPGGRVSRQSQKVRVVVATFSVLRTH